VAAIAGGYWWLVLPILIGAVILLRRWARKPKGRALMDRVKLKSSLSDASSGCWPWPVFARTLATMLSSGVPVLTALDIVKRVLNNTVLEKVIEDARVAIREGESIAATLKKSGQFPSMMCHMVAVGERSGQLEAHAGERGRRLRARRGDGGEPHDFAFGPHHDPHDGGGRRFIIFSILVPIMDMGNMVQ